METKKPNDNLDKNILVIIRKISETLRKDSIMVTLIIIACIICIYFAYYSMNYDKKIQEKYNEYIMDNCFNLNGSPVFKRPSPLSTDALLENIVIINENQNTDKNS